MSIINYHDGVSVETEVKQGDDFDSLNETNFQFFGLSEKGIQTDLTMRDIIELDNHNKELKEKKLTEQKNGKPDHISAEQLPLNTPNIKKDKDIINKSNESKNSNMNIIDKLSHIEIEPFKDNGNNFSGHKICLAKNSLSVQKKSKKDEKKDIFLEKKRKRDEEKSSSMSNNNKNKHNKEIIRSKEKEKDNNKEKSKEKIKVKEIIKSKDKDKDKEKEIRNFSDKIKNKNKILKDKFKKRIKEKDEESEKNNITEKKEIRSERKEKKEKRSVKKNENSNNKNNKNDKNDKNENDNVSDIQNIINNIIDNSVTKSNSRGGCPKIDAYSIFKKEYKQSKKGKDDDKSENTMKNEWRKVPKDLKKLYNINAEKQNKQIKEYYALSTSKIKKK